MLLWPIHASKLISPEHNLLLPSIDDGLEEGSVLVRVPGAVVQPTLEERLILGIYMLTALKLWRQGAGSLAQTLWARYVFEPIDLEAIVAVDGGGVFEQLAGSQRDRCQEHTDVEIENVKQERLKRHETAWRAERELLSNPRVQRREFGSVELSHRQESSDSWEVRSVSVVMEALTLARGCLVR